MELKFKKKKKNPAATQSLSTAEGKKMLYHQPWKFSESLVISSGQSRVRRSTDGYCALSPAIRAAAPELQHEHNPGAGAVNVLYCHI